MAEPWPGDEERDRFIRFLELELQVVQVASRGGLDPDLLSELNELLIQWFPRTSLFIESRILRDPSLGFGDEVAAVAWAEARAGGVGSEARVAGVWTRQEIADDIVECFRVARERSGVME